MRLGVLLVLLLGCRGATAPPEGGLHGVAAAEALPVPEFSALSHDGAVRQRDDLMGQPTAMWFFPAAGTPG